jgi:hypothetical protein
MSAPTKRRSIGSVGWCIRENHEPLGIPGGSGLVTTEVNGVRGFFAYTRSQALEVLRALQQRCAASEDHETREFGTRLYMQRTVLS